MKAKIPHHLTDGGRAEAGYVREQLDCTVRAVAAGAALPYAQAHALLAAHGRRNKRRFYFDRFADNVKGQHIGEFVFCRQWYPRATLATFIADHPQGRFVVRTRGHVVAVVDGVVLDNIPPRPRTFVTDVWAVLPHAQQTQGGRDEQG